MWRLHPQRQNTNRNSLTTPELLPLHPSFFASVYFCGWHIELLLPSETPSLQSHYPPLTNRAVHTTPIKLYIACVSLPHLSSISSPSTVIAPLWIYFLRQCWSVGTCWESLCYRQTELQCIISRDNDCVLLLFTDNTICHIEPEGMWACFDWTEAYSSY